MEGVPPGAHTILRWYQGSQPAGSGAPETTYEKQRRNPGCPGQGCLSQLRAPYSSQTQQGSQTAVTLLQPETLQTHLDSRSGPAQDASLLSVLSLCSCWWKTLGSFCVLSSKAEMNGFRLCNHVSRYDSITKQL